MDISLPLYFLYWEIFMKPVLWIRLALEYYSLKLEKLIRMNCGPDLVKVN